MGTKRLYSVECVMQYGKRRNHNYQQLSLLLQLLLQLTSHKPVAGTVKRLAQAHKLKTSSRKSFAALAPSDQLVDNTQQQQLQGIYNKKRQRKRESKCGWRRAGELKKLFIHNLAQQQQQQQQLLLQQAKIPAAFEHLCCLLLFL